MPRMSRGSAIVVPTELKDAFRKTCIGLDLKPKSVVVSLLSRWIEKQKARKRSTVRRATA